MGGADGEDAALVACIAEGGVAAREAEAELCRRFAPRVRLYGLQHLRSDDRANELVQAVLLAVIEAARSRRIAEPSKVDRFMLGTCRHTVSRMHASSRRLEPLAFDPEAADEETSFSTDLAALMRCIDQLEERARSIVTMSFRDERSSEDIAHALAMTEGNVRVVRHRAVHALRRCLDGKFEVAS